MKSTQAERRIARHITWVGGAMLFLAACHPPGPTPPPVQSIAIPRGCERSFAGAWTHTQDKGFHYSATDDGHTLVLLHQRVRAPTPRAPDAGLVTMVDAGVNTEALEPVRVVLERTTHGFLGEVQAQIDLTDRRCALTFPVEILACTPDELRLRVMPSRSVDPTCAIAPVPPAPWAEHRLRRDAAR